MSEQWPYRFFSREELQCKCGCGGIPQDDFIRKLDTLRQTCGFPLPVTSGYRCPDYNAKVSGTGKTGPHTTGRAVDIAVNRAEAYQLVGHAMFSANMSGIGLQQKGSARFVHLDDLPNAEGQPRPTVWSY